MVSEAKESLNLTFITPMAAMIKFLTVGSWPLRATSRSSSALGGEAGGRAGGRAGGGGWGEVAEGIVGSELLVVSI